MHERMGKGVHPDSPQADSHGCSATNPPRKPPKLIGRAKSGLVACFMQNLMAIMVGVVSELSDGPELSNLGF